MLETLIKGVALDLIAGVLRHPDPSARRKFAEAYWDLQYLYRFGIPKISGIDELPRPFPPEPRPHPSPIDRTKIHEEVLFGLAKALLMDPEPEPNISSVFGDKAVKLAAAKNLSQRLLAAEKLLTKEIARLETLR